MELNHHYVHHLEENNPEQLKQVISNLIDKSRILLNSLEDIYDQFQESEKQKMFWKQSYFELKHACQQYVSSGGLAPFNYIASLQDQLKKGKVYKSCLEEKFKVMMPNSRPYSRKTHNMSESVRQVSQKASINQHFGKQLSSTFVKQTPQRVKYSSKHKIGPKNIEFFKFGQQKNSQQQSRR